jgi:hypothetical protein
MIYCAECLAQDAGVNEMITQIDGTAFCKEHALKYAVFKAEKAAKQNENERKILESLGTI